MPVGELLSQSFEGFIQVADPGAVGPDMLWVNRSTGLAQFRNSANSAWVTITAGGGGGVGTVTNTGTLTANRLIIGNGGVDVAPAAAITAARALISDANGVPTHSVTTGAELAFVNGVTSGIQAQLDVHTAAIAGIGAPAFSAITAGTNTTAAMVVGTGGSLATSGSGTIVATSLSATLAATAGGTGQTVYAVGDLLYANTTTTLNKLADVAVGSYLRSTGVGIAPVWSTVTLPNSAVVGDLLSVSATNVYANITAVALGQVLASGGVATLPAWTATPRLSGILDANGNPAVTYGATASAVYGLTFTNAALLGTVAIGVTAPTQVAASVAGTPLSITAQAAVAGSSSAGAAAGGAVTITSGAAARLTSGNANGGNINLVTGAGIGTGTAGACVFPVGVVTVPSIQFLGDTAGFFSPSAGIVDFTSGNNSRVRISTQQVAFSSTMSLAFRSVSAPDTFMSFPATATIQYGAADVNGSAVAQITQVQSAITGTDQNGADWTFKGSKQTGAGTPGNIIFQTSPKLASGTTQGTPEIALKLTAPPLNMHPSVVVGNQALATTATDGFLYIPTCAGTPTGVPTAFTGRVALVYDTTNFQFWIYDGAWKQPKTPAGAALVTWQ